MSSSPKKSAVAEHRRRLRNRGLCRLEIQVGLDDVPLVRAVAAALIDPASAESARGLLSSHFTGKERRNLKDLLASAPIEGIEFERSQDSGRIIDL